ncbi:unnamed protein product, partial [Symbiodinium pilosum]
RGAEIQAQSAPHPGDRCHCQQTSSGSVHGFCVCGRGPYGALRCASSPLVVAQSQARRHHCRPRLCAGETLAISRAICC